MRSVLNRFVDSMVKYGLEYFGLFYGEYDGICLDNEDKGEQGRILVRVPSVSGLDTIGAWAWPTSIWSGRDSGFFVVPDVGDRVTVTFRNGNPSYPKYTGGSWPNVGGSDNFTPKGYVDGKPVVRMLRTKAGHEFSMSDDPDTLSVKLIWHDPATDKYTFITIDGDGSIIFANHKGALFEMRSTDEDLNMLVDSRGNTFVQDADGIKMLDANGNAIFTTSDGVGVIGSGDVVVSSPGVNLKTGSVILGDGSSQDIVRGTAFFQWLTTVFLPHYLAHTHGTGVGPSGPPIAPLQNPVQVDVLSDKVKVP